MSQAELLVDLEAIKENWIILGSMSSARASAVVKADGYGTGMLRVAEALVSAGCQSFFVASASEGSALRSVSSDLSIHVLEGLIPGSEREHHEYQLTPVLNDLEQVERWQATCAAMGNRPAAIHVDTGINRLGVSHYDLGSLVKTLSRSRMEIDLVMSHLACAEDVHHPLNLKQLSRFQRVSAAFPGIEASLCGSAGILLGPEYHFDLVRPGIGLYGGLDVKTQPRPIRPVVTVRAPILQIHNLPAGETAGYGARFISNRERILATVGAGYADGFPRSLSNKGVAFTGTTALPYVGTVSMDSIVVDVTEATDFDEPIELLGENITIVRLARLADTIPNELLTRLGGRLVRKYIEKVGRDQ